MSLLQHNQRSPLFIETRTQSEFKQEVIFELFSKMPLNTQIAYAHDINHFNKWCFEQRCSEVSNDLSSNTFTFKAYFSQLIDSDVSRSTIERKKSSLSKYLDLTAKPNPFKKEPLFKEWYRLSLREKPEFQNQAEPLTVDLLETINDSLSNECPLQLRNKVMVNIMFDGLLRADEVCNIFIEHINFRTRALFIPKSKTDQTGKGLYKLISETTMRLIKLWMEKYKVKENHLLRNLSPSLKVRSTGIKYRTVYNTLKELSQLVIVNKNFSGHSARVGGAITLAENDCSLLDIQRSGGWKTAIMPARYTEQVNLHKTGMGRIADKIGR